MLVTLLSMRVKMMEHSAMSDENRNVEVKKRIMFHLEDDYYFITYHILLFLKIIGCNSSSNRLKDYSKLCYILPFISNDLHLRILTKQNDNEMPFSEDRKMLREIYLKSRLKRNLVSSIVFALHRKELVCLEKRSNSTAIDIWLNERSDLTFLTTNFYDYESENIRAFRRLHPRIKILTTETLLKKLYTEKGVTVWGI